ncbi:unnamed protein product [Porites lobata]|uniref:Uncharacterized protein n=1 Tax=Porites lobata TaxID=104759 RepID=A0ABN8PUI0_9CNID|nr:unnamed protein product [Porites lobata]
MHFSYVFVVLSVLTGVRVTAVINTVNNDHQSAAICCDKPSVVCNCNINTDQSSSNVSEAIEALERKVDHLISLVSNSSTSSPEPTNPPGIPVASCKEQYDNDPSSISQVYNINFGLQEVPVFCHMGDFGCGDGGWTLAVKINGSKRTFHYDSFLWSDTNTYNVAGGKTGFDMKETKLPSYWATPFTRVCLGMRIGQQVKFVPVDMKASSLHSLIAGGVFQATSLGRDKWKSLIGSYASLQTGCNREGFNAVASQSDSAKARIGILGNDQGDCVTCDSRIGFGTGGHTDDSNTCGDNTPNGFTSDNGGRNIKAMGYILVQ